MPNFSAAPPVVELYDPANVVGFIMAGQRYTCIKGTFREDVVEVPSPYEGGRAELKQMFECNIIVDTPRSELFDVAVRFLGASSSITAVMVDDL